MRRMLRGTVLLLVFLSAVFCFYYSLAWFLDEYEGDERFEPDEQSELVKLK
ncbi:hypothetical protein B0H94_111115 [Salsuginibacillus halophilus]|uniref:Uncharacterized protein n=1 Tax=Salsuginibacillus halophilus TaxID=517424 RepID=A0A2P8HAS8_9BACI|nr:hypothetical protein [Salsuginibacillus halophilus]PSL43289.1 hypothetical protein B0H94_111115 [Salsuginibacillus halophilus]